MIFSAALLLSHLWKGLLHAISYMIQYVSGKSGPVFSSSSGSRLGSESSVKSLPSQTTLQETPMIDGQSHLSAQGKEVLSNSHLDCIHIGSRGSEGTLIL